MNIAKVLESKGSGTVLTIPETATLAEFVRLACEKGVGALLVVGASGAMAGILSERDILRQCQAGADFSSVRVKDVMVRDVATVGPKEDVNKAMDLMVVKGIRHLPIIGDGKMLGLITVRDIMQALRRAEADDIRYLIQYLQSNMEKENVSL